jgi:hypothetical protein
LPREPTPNPEAPPARESLRVRVAQRAAAGLRTAWERARNERSTPREVALSVGLGVFCACTPFVGLHMWIALGLATVLRLNRLWAFLGSRCIFFPILPVVTFAEIEVAHRIRTGGWLPLVPSEAVARGRELLVDWALGTLVVGGAIAAVAAGGAYAVALSWPAPGAAPERS